MAVLTCEKCKAKVESNRCCGEPMVLQGEVLKCQKCQKTVQVNRCCGESMKGAKA